MSATTCLRGLTLMLALMPALLQAQESRTERVHFPRGSDNTVLRDSIRGYGDVTYVLGASAGQSLQVDMSTSNASAYFNVTAPGADEALFVGSTSGNSFDAVLPSDGDYKVMVYLMRNAARRDETADFTVKLRIAAKREVALPAPDFADGDAGGPDFWQVTGLASGDTLNVRSGPSTSGAIVGRLRNGDTLRNRGCRSEATQRWCQIEGARVSGWVAGRYLREASGPEATVGEPTASPEGAVRGNGEPFTATGTTPCAAARGQPMGQCAFGVIRPARGEANVWIALGNGTERYILFQDGQPAFTDGEADLSWTKEADLFLLRVGSERFEIPEAMVFGG